MDANDVEKPQGQKKSAKHNSGAADLEKVTDFAEEREVLPQDITNAFNLIDNRRSKEAAEKLARERELAKVTIKKEDVETLIKETEIPRQKAERILRENNGNLVQALVQVVNS